MNNKKHSFIFTSRNKDKFTIVAFEEKTLICSEGNLKIIQNITRQSWGDPGKLAKKWLELSDIMLIAYDSNSKPVAFALANFLANDVTLMISTMVDKCFQQMGLGIHLNKKILICAIQKGSKLRNHYLVYRTPNPTLYARTSRNMKLFPSTHRDKPNKKEVEIFQTIVKNFSINNEQNKDTFVIKEAYKEAPDLIYDVSNIPWSGNTDIDNLFENMLHLKNKEGNTMVIIGTLPFIKKILVPFL